MHQKIEDCLALINDPLIRAFCVNILEEIHDKFISSPGSTGRHHAFAGGLLFHSASVAKLCGDMADHYIMMGKPINKSIAVAGGLLQDIGKIHCYAPAELLEGNNRWVSTLEDEYFHHIPIGFHMASTIAERMGVQNHDDIKHVLHLIISHHGRKEWSSPRTPKTSEAMIVHHADYIDAFMYATEEAAKQKSSGVTY